MINENLIFSKKFEFLRILDIFLDPDIQRKFGSGSENLSYAKTQTTIACRDRNTKIS